MTTTIKNVKHVEKNVTLAKIARWMEIIDPLQRNVRSEKSYNRPELVDSIREYGLQDPIWVVKTDKGSVSNPEREYTPLRGFSRREALEALITEYPEGYQNDDKSIRKFDTVPVRVVDTNDPITRALLQLDHGDHKGLSRLELFNSFEKLYILQAKEKDMVTRLRGSIEVNYPPDKKLPDVPNPSNADGTLKSAEAFKKEYDAYQMALLKHYKGVIQQFKLIAEAPTVLREVAMAKLDGTKKWPTNEELRDGMKIYEDEVSKDSTAMFSKQNPGPEFKAWFDNISGIKAEAEKDGTLRGKTNAMMNAQQVRNLLKQITDPRLRRMVQIVLRQVPITNLAILDKITAAHVLTEDEKSILGSMQTAAEDSTKESEESEESEEDSTKESEEDSTKESEEVPV